MSIRLREVFAVTTIDACCGGKAGGSNVATRWLEAARLPLLARVGAGRRRIRLAEPEQVGGDDSVGRREPLRDRAPGPAPARDPVEQQHRRAAAAPALRRELPAAGAEERGGRGGRHAVLVLLQEQARNETGDLAPTRAIAGPAVARSRGHGGRFEPPAVRPRC